MTEEIEHAVSAETSKYMPDSSSFSIESFSDLTQLSQRDGAGERREVLLQKLSGFVSEFGAEKAIRAPKVGPQASFVVNPCMKPK